MIEKIFDILASLGISLFSIGLSGVSILLIIDAFRTGLFEGFFSLVVAGIILFLIAGSIVGIIIEEKNK